MGQVIINGKSYSGRSITINNNKITIDGKDATPEKALQIDIKVEGDIDTLKVDQANIVTVTGQVSSVSTMSGNVKIEGDVSGSVKTMTGDVTCKQIKGNVSTMSGDINKSLTQSDLFASDI